MVLHNIVPQEQTFDWQDAKGARRPTPMVGIFLGSPGKNYRHVFVPVEVPNKHEPESNWWGIRESRTNRPKIVAGSDASEGVIAVVSAHRGPGKTVGKVLVAVEHINHVFVVAQGLGGQERPACNYSEYLLEISQPTTLMIIHTDGSRSTWSWESEEVLTNAYPVENFAIETDFVPLDDPRVRKWTRSQEHVA